MEGVGAGLRFRQRAGGARERRACLTGYQLMPSAGAGHVGSQWGTGTTRLDQPHPLPPAWILAPASEAGQPCTAAKSQALLTAHFLHPANYSMPVVSSPGAVPQGSELTFTCTSTNGYPAPRVYWINRTDSSLLDEALQNNTVSLNARGLYDVVSVLTVPHSPHVDVGCCIENALLRQNLTVGSQPGGSPVPEPEGSVPGTCWAMGQASTPWTWGPACDSVWPLPC